MVIFFLVHSKASRSSGETLDPEGVACPKNSGSSHTKHREPDNRQSQKFLISRTPYQARLDEYVCDGIGY